MTFVVIVQSGRLPLTEAITKTHDDDDDDDDVVLWIGLDRKWRLFCKGKEIINHFSLSLSLCYTTQQQQHKKYELIQLAILKEKNVSFYFGDEAVVFVVQYYSRKNLFSCFTTLM